MAGSGNPLVVFEAGIGVCASVWVRVQPLVAAHNRTLAYDRAGFGGSDEDPAPRSLERMVADLAAVLSQLDQESPVILVGSSLGGAIVRLFALSHPERVAGLVLVDPAMAEAEPEWLTRRRARGFTLAATLARVGLHKPLIMAAMKPALPPSMPQAARSVLIRDLTSPRNQRAAAREAQEIGDLGSTLTDLQSRGLPDVPVTTIVAALADRPKLANLRATMIEVGRREMENHSGGRFVIASQSSHPIPSQQPELVAAEITRVVEMVR
jgi:pimeloyl-ACP methyl ester carboxylesterase